ncbi:hypothetical protein EON68_02450, partial [archaeon]
PPASCAPARAAGCSDTAHPTGGGQCRAHSPAQLAAQANVRDIDRRQLDELCRYNQPPELVRMTLEAVLVLLGHEPSTLDWAEMRRSLRSADFISNVVNFKSDALSRGRRAMLSEKYIAGKAVEDVCEDIFRASRACGPLYRWVVSQVRFSEMLDLVGPLRAQLSTLTDERELLAARVGEVNARLAALEASIAGYRADYAALIRDAEALRGEMSAVQSKVERSSALVASLANERVRWEGSDASFAAALTSCASDALLGAAFCAYAGGFAFEGRTALEAEWRNILADMGVPAGSSGSIVDSMVGAAQRLAWAAAGVPQDDVSYGNGIILARAHRFPLIIDPSAAILPLLPALLSRPGAPAARAGAGKAALARASMLDANYLKALESAVRFGTHLLLTDADAFDPILNPVLNRQASRAGGVDRALVRIGEVEVDLSPSFALALFSKSAAAAFTPDITSRCTPINFAVSLPSLAATLLTRVLAAEVPAVAERRREV